MRDGYGIPHIRAGSAADAWFAMGLACAQDRLFQMEYDRRRATGRWAEVAGPAAVPGDVLARRLNITEAAHADVAVMSEPVRAMFEAYARGVNEVIGSGTRPAELGGTVIEPWQPWHSVAAYKVRHILMGHWQYKLAEATVLARAGAEAFSRLDLRPPAGAPLSVPPGGRLARVIAEASDDVARAAPHLGFLAEAEPGSNAWAVSGRRTAHGGAVLCNDSHRALDVPNVYWQCHLSCPDFDVIGAAFAGVPGFPHFGHNGHVAWAITHGSADTQDLYLEQFDESRPGWYRTENGWQQARRRTETIMVRDGEPVTAEVWTTRHGQVVHGDPRAGMAIALKYTATCKPGRGFEPLLPMLAARDVAELIDAQREWVDPVNNLVAADTAGQIAYQARGELPVRSSAAHRRLPVPGWDGACEWTGTVPFDQMPRLLDPEAGYVMTANNVITDGDEPYISYTFSQPFRAETAPAAAGGHRAAHHRGARRPAVGHGFLGRSGVVPPAGRARPADRGFGRTGPADAGRLGRRTARGFRPGAALRLLPAGAGRRSLPPAARRRHLALAGPRRRRCRHPGPPVAGQRHLGTARRSGRGR